MKLKLNVLLKQNIFKLFLVLITLFSINNVDASSFAYAAFDWDKFYKENVGYWTDYCKSYSGSISTDDCIDIVLNGKKEYYIKLYKLLAKFEKKGYKLDDNIILATTFFDLTPDTFTEIPEEYKKEYLDGSAYNIDLSENIDAYDVDTDESIEYFQNEKDSLKVLTKHMFAYKASCSGEVATPSTDENGNKYCSKGSLSGDSCVDVIKTYDLNYTEYLITKLGFVGSLFGLKDENKDDCYANGGSSYSVNNKKEISYDTYWEFLTESTYFDKKVHLTSRYSKVLKATNHQYMSELTEEEYETYKEDLIKIRERIVAEIRSILEDYKDYMADTPDSYTNAGCTGGSAWWPIGSDDETLENGVTFAKGEPASVLVTSKFGPRIHPITGQQSQHSGIDIGGVSEGVTNVIAVKDGVVVYPTDGSPTNCPSSSSMSDCGGGYGNYVIIQHNDGTYTLYAHLYADSITVKANDSVKQGQVIGKVGSSGNSTGAHLHFEIRQGNNSSSSTVDPLNSISADNPRSSGGMCGGSSSEFSKMLHWFEGGCNAKSNGNNYVVIDDSYGYPTAGYGVALEFNIDRFKNYGIDVTHMTFGDEIAKDIVDKVELDEVNENRTYMQDYLAKRSITLTDYQIDALVMVKYQFGNIGNFAETYQQYGNTDSLRQYTHNHNASWYYFRQNPSSGNGRAEATWKLFHEGVYTYGDSC